MIIDSLNEFSDAQAMTTAGTGTTASTNAIDLNAAGDAFGKELYLLVVVTTAITSGGSATVQWKLETDDNDSFSSATTLYDSGAVAKATLVAGYRVCAIRIPEGCERYLRVTYTVGTAALTAGAFDAFLTEAPQANDFTA